MWGIFFEAPTLNNPSADRARLRAVAVECSALVDILDELYPTTQLPDINATDREIGAWLGQRELVKRLQTLRREATASVGGSLPPVLRS